MTFPWNFHEIISNSMNLNILNESQHLFLAKKKTTSRGWRALPPWPPWPHRPRPRKSDHPPPWLARRSFPSWEENGEERFSKPLGISGKCHENVQISSDIYWYLRYISDISCLGRFVRWIRRSCNDVIVLDVDLGVILGMTGYLDIRKVGRSQPTKRGPLWHGTWWKFKGRMSRQDWERLALNLAGGFQPHGYPQSIHVNKMFHYKPLINHPAIWGYPFFGNRPVLSIHLIRWDEKYPIQWSSCPPINLEYNLLIKKSVNQWSVNQPTNQPISQPTGKPSINQPAGKIRPCWFIAQLHKSFAMFFLQTFPGQKNLCRAAGILHHRYLQLPLPSAQLWYFWPVETDEKCHGTATSGLIASTFLFYDNAIWQELGFA